MKVIHDFTDVVIANRRRELLQKQGSLSQEPSVDEFGVKKRMALLDVLLQSTVDGQPLTNEEIRDEVDTFMVAGQDTTASGMSFALYNIARNPEVQKKLVKEIHDVLGEDQSAPITLQLLGEMHYLDAVLKETLRMYPSAPVIGRYIEEDMTINGQEIVAGTNVILGIIFMHMDPAIFPEPEQFRPERFLEERDPEKFNPFSYVPFR